MRLFAIDPGTTWSAFMVYAPDDSDGPIARKGILPNEEVLAALTSAAFPTGSGAADECVIEMVASYGMAVGAEVFETVRWIGRFEERWSANANGKAVARMVRKDVKMHLCGNNRAKDANIRQALIDRFGPGKEKAIGKKTQPGPLFGVKEDIWAALALAVTYHDSRRSKLEQTLIRAAVEVGKWPEWKRGGTAAIPRVAP